MAELLKSFQESARYMMAQTYNVIDVSQGKDTISQKAARQFVKDAIVQLRNDGLDFRQAGANADAKDLSRQFIRMISPLLNEKEKAYLAKNHDTYETLICMSLITEVIEQQMIANLESGKPLKVLLSVDDGQGGVKHVSGNSPIDALQKLRDVLSKLADDDNGPPPPAQG